MSDTLDSVLGTPVVEDKNVKVTQIEDTLNVSSSDAVVDSAATNGTTPEEPVKRKPGRPPKSAATTDIAPAAEEPKSTKDSVEAARDKTKMKETTAIPEESAKKVESVEVAAEETAPRKDVQIVSAASAGAPLDISHNPGGIVSARLAPPSRETKRVVELHVGPNPASRYYAVSGKLHFEGKTHGDYIQVSGHVNGIGKVTGWVLKKDYV